MWSVVDTAEEVSRHLPDFEMTASWTVVQRSTGDVLSKTRAVAGRKDMSLRTDCKMHRGTKCKLHIMAGDFHRANAISMMWDVNSIGMNKEDQLRAAEVGAIEVP